MSHTRRAWGIAVVGLGLLTMAATRQAKSSLAGTWKFNPDKTAEAGKEVKDPKVQEARRQGGRMPTIGAGRVDGVKGGGAAPSTGGGFGGAGLPGPLGLYARPLPQLVIEQTDSTVTMTDVSGTPRIYHTDGKKRFEPLLGADTLEITAKWGKDGRLTTDRKLGGFGIIREVFALDPATHELVIEVRISGGSLSEPVNLVRVYDTGA